MSLSSRLQVGLLFPQAEPLNLLIGHKAFNRKGIGGKTSVARDVLPRPLRLRPSERFDETTSHQLCASAYSRLFLLSELLRTSYCTRYSPGLQRTRGGRHVAAQCLGPAMSGHSLYDPDQAALNTRWIQPWSEAFRVSSGPLSFDCVIVSYYT